MRDPPLVSSQAAEREPIPVIQCHKRRGLDERIVQNIELTPAKAQRENPNFSLAVAGLPLGRACALR